jgi:hypothetical protein
MRRQVSRPSAVPVTPPGGWTPTRPWPIPSGAVAEGVALVEDACRQRRCGVHGLETVIGYVARSAGLEVGHVYACGAAPGSAATAPVLPTRIWYLQPPVSRFAAFVRTTAAAELVPGEGLPGRVVTTAAPVVIEQLPGDAHMARARAALSCGLRSACAYPVPAHPGLTVVLEFLAGGPLHRTDELDALVGRLTDVLLPHLRETELEDLL